MHYRYIYSIRAGVHCSSTHTVVSSFVESHPGPICRDATRGHLDKGDPLAVDTTAPPVPVLDTASAALAVGLAA